MSKRLETGPVHMPGDWPGVFIRGDQAAHFAIQLDRLKAEIHNNKADIDAVIQHAALEGLIETLMSCVVIAGRTPDATPIQFARTPPEPETDG